MKTIRLREQDIETIIYELNQGVIGDNSRYDKTLKRISKKFEDILT